MKSNMSNNTKKSSDSTYLLEEGMIINGKWKIWYHKLHAVITVS